MLRIECPWCGVRDEPEFTYGGESHVTRPPAGAGDEEWAQYLFFRSNPQGEHAERWCHSFGCGQWFNVRAEHRDARDRRHLRPGERPLSRP